jgi:heat shock protein HtpX
MKQSHSVAGRAVLAIVLLIGFYVLALAVAGGLLAIPYLEWKHLGQVHIKLALLCVIAGLLVLWGIVPRIDRFVAPGPKLTREKHPKLFAEIDNIARAVNQAGPAEVFLVHDVNAWVAQRGGIMGVGSRRVMGLGLPLLRHLTIPEVRAVLAHEFGHYHSGDTKVGPWIYKTRSIIVRTIETLAGEGGQGSPLQLPFIWYGQMFTRITHAISRRQEFVADEVAARTAGSAPLISGLRKVHGIGAAFEGFWANEYVPTLNAGYMPSLMAGFERFLSAAPIADAVSKHLEEEMQGGKANPYDTHPPLKERIAAVEHLPAGDASADTPAITLLEDAAELEKLLLSTLIVPSPGTRFQPLDWNELGAKVYLPPWKHLVTANARNLKGMTIGTLQSTVSQRGLLSWVTADGQPVLESYQAQLANSVVGAALVLALMDRGWQLDVAPGAPVIVRNGEHTLEPFTIFDSLANQKIAAADWEQKCRDFGIAEIELAPSEDSAQSQAA